MDKYELIKKLSAKANVTYGEAEEALEASDWDLLDAFLLLEKQGKTVKESGAQSYTTQKKKEYNWNARSGEVRAEVGGWLSKFWKWFKNALNKGNANQFVITRRNEELIAMPITVLVLLMLCFWPVSLILLFVALFFKVRYAFRGPNISERINVVIHAAQEKTAGAVHVRRDSDSEDKDE